MCIWLPYIALFFYWPSYFLNICTHETFFKRVHSLLSTLHFSLAVIFRVWIFFCWYFWGFLHNEKILEDIEQNRLRGASCHQFDLHCLKRKQRNSGYRRSSQDVKTKTIICKLLILLVPSMTNSICGCVDDKRLLESLQSALSTAEEPEPMEKFTMTTRVLLHLRYGFRYTSTQPLHVNDRCWSCWRSSELWEKNLKNCRGHLHNHLFCQFQYQIYKIIHLNEGEKSLPIQLFFSLFWCHFIFIIHS